MVGDFPNLGTVWLNKTSITNILSLADVQKICRVTMDTKNETAMCVRRLDGSVMRFEEHSSGLYVFNATSSDTINAYTMHNTVAAQKKLFSAREVTGADAARNLYWKIGRPSEAEFQHILRNNQIHNCPVTPDDARRVLIIYGPDIGVIKGKNTRGPAATRTPTFIAELTRAHGEKICDNIKFCDDRKRCISCFVL